MLRISGKYFFVLSVMLITASSASAASRACFNIFKLDPQLVPRFEQTFDDDIYKLKITVMKPEVEDKEILDGSVKTETEILLNQFGKDKPLKFVTAIFDLPIIKAFGKAKSFFVQTDQGLNDFLKGQSLPHTLLVWRYYKSVVVQQRYGGELIDGQLFRVQDSTTTNTLTTFNEGFTSQYSTQGRKIDIHIGTHYYTEIPKNGWTDYKQNKQTEQFGTLELPKTIPGSIIDFQFNAENTILTLVLSSGLEVSFAINARKLEPGNPYPNTSGILPGEFKLIEKRELSPEEFAAYIPRVETSGRRITRPYVRERTYPHYDGE